MTITTRSIPKQTNDIIERREDGIRRGENHVLDTKSAFQLGPEKKRGVHLGDVN